MRSYERKNEQREPVRGVSVKDIDKQFERIDQIIGNGKDVRFRDAIVRFYEHLQNTLQLPCEVTGIEDFKWEESYIMGPGDPKKHDQLRKKQPSYQDVFDLLAIHKGLVSKWMLFPGKDLAAHVRRKSDGKEFCLGLAELKVIDKQSQNFQPLDDYALWFANYQ
jgi:hypothetical protein